MKYSPLKVSRRFEGKRRLHSQSLRDRLAKCFRLNFCLIYFRP
jgi:hypothetical protein